jgi:hypothetical protein
MVYVVDYRASVLPSSPCVVFLFIGAVVLLPALSTLAAQTLSLERWLTVVIMGSIPIAKFPVMGHPPPHQMSKVSGDH